MRPRRLHRRLQRGHALPLLLALLVLLGGGGAWNYHRNLQAERAEPRPYRGYDDAELASLIEAYEQESDALRGRAERVERPQATASEGALVGERVEVFERARQAGEAERRLRRDAQGHESVLEALREERARRDARATGLALHLRRLTTF